MGVIFKGFRFLEIEVFRGVGFVWDFEYFSMGCFCGCGLR